MPRPKKLRCERCYKKPASVQLTARDEDGDIYYCLLCAECAAVEEAAGILNEYDKQELLQP